MTIAYLNGGFLPLADAKISVMDRGFLFGDGVYEVSPVFNGKLFSFEHHIKRLQHSLREIQLEISLSLEDWRDIALKLVTETEGLDQLLYLQVTRGGTMERNHLFPAPTKPTIFAYSAELKAQDNAKGIRTITRDDPRWKRCDIKSISLLANVLLAQEALNEGVDDTILMHDGVAIEGSSSNIFVVKDDVLHTPPQSEKILGGITREIILDLAKTNNIPTELKYTSKESLITADEIWLTSSSREIRPVIEVDGQAIGNGQAGPLWHKINELYQAFKRSV